MEQSVTERLAGTGQDSAVEAASRALDTVEGAVKWYDPVKGFGFVVPDDGGADIFLGKAIVDSAALGAPTEGARVTVTVRSRPQGRSAAEMLKLSAPADDWHGNGGGRSRAAAGWKQPPVSDVVGPKRGNVKMFNEPRGFGFVTLGDGTPDIFVHVTVLLPLGMRSLVVGEEVYVTWGNGPKGLMAVAIERSR